VRVANDGRDPAEPAAPGIDQTVRHVLVPLIEKDAGDRRVRATHLLEERLRRLVVPVQLLLDDLRGDHEADDGPDDQTDALPDRQRTEEPSEGVADRIVDEEDREVALLGDRGGDAHLRPGDAAAHLRAQPSLEVGPQPEEDRGARAPRRFGRLGLEERGGPLRVELERDRVEVPGRQHATERGLEVDHVGRADEQDRRLGRARPHASREPSVGYGRCGPRETISAAPG